VAHAYEADAPDHFGMFPLEQYNHIMQKVEPVAPIVRRVTKLEFIGRLGNDFDALFDASKTVVAVEKFMKMLDWATPEQDGTSIDLDDARVAYALNAFEGAGFIATGRAAEILA
jgi:hypothetical protein